MKARRFGEEFERAFQASVPPGVWKWKLRTPAPPAYEAPRIVALVDEQHAEIVRLYGLLAMHAQGICEDPEISGAQAVSYCKLCGRQEDGGPIKHQPTCALANPPAEVPPWVQASLRWSRFTSKAGFDVILSAPAAHEPLELLLADALGRPTALRVRPRIVWCLELKSVDGASLPFANVELGQEKALREAADQAQLAGLLVEFRGPGEVWFVPIGAWLDFRMTTDRKSLPVDVARRVGMQILPDPQRGVSRQYWDVAAWIIRCGGLLPEKPPKGESKKKKQAAAQPAPADEPEVQAVPVPLTLFNL